MHLFDRFGNFSGGILFLSEERQQWHEWLELWEQYFR